MMLKLAPRSPLGVDSIGQVYNNLSLATARHSAKIPPSEVGSLLLILAVRREDNYFYLSELMFVTLS